MSKRQITIAVDAMGGENSPFKCLKGIEIFHLKKPEVNFRIYGDKILISKSIKDNSSSSKKKINEELVKNLVNDLDKSLRDIGISDMSIGKYVKKYVKKFYYRLKILDPIFENDNNEEFYNYLNSLEFVNKNNLNELADQLSEFFLQIKNNNE